MLERTQTTSSNARRYSPAPSSSILSIAMIPKGNSHTARPPKSTRFLNGFSSRPRDKDLTLASSSGS